MIDLFRVTVLNKLIKSITVPSQLFFRLLDELMAEVPGHSSLFNNGHPISEMGDLKGAVSGVLSGGRSAERAVWIPHVYHLMLHSYTSSYYSDNGFVGSVPLPSLVSFAHRRRIGDIAALRKLGVADVKDHLDSALGKAARDLVHLSTLALGPSLWADTRAKVTHDSPAFILLSFS